jgi:acyl-CoA synthetase (AMP-forming)/AMP-acid ligase II
VYPHARFKDRIVTGGENVFPAEVETALMRHPATADVAVFGVPDEKWGEVVTALVLAAAGPAPGARELCAFCHQHLARYKVGGVRQHSAPQAVRQAAKAPTAPPLLGRSGTPD